MLYYKRIGNGIPMIIIHGANVDHRLMSESMEPIFNEIISYERIYIDLPGMGKSQEIGNIRSSDDMLNEVLKTIKEILDDRSFLLVGESYGGYIARGIIEKIREQVLGVFLLCPVIVPDSAMRIIPKEIPVQYDEEFLSTLSKEERENFCSMAIVANETVYKRFMASVQPGLNLANVSFLNELKKHYAFSFPLETKLFYEPSLFILGKQDNVLGYQNCLSVIDCYVQANVAIINQAGHNLQIEQPEIFSQLVIHWLNQIR